MSPNIVAPRIAANMSSPDSCHPSCRIHRCVRAADDWTYTAPPTTSPPEMWIVVPGGSRHRLRSPVIGSSSPRMVMLIVPAGGFAASRRAFRAASILLSTFSHAIACGMSLFMRPPLLLVGLVDDAELFARRRSFAQVVVEFVAAVLSRLANVAAG